MGGGGRRVRILFVGCVRRERGRVEIDMAPYYLCLWTSSNFGKGGRGNQFDFEFETSEIKAAAGARREIKQRMVTPFPSQI